MRRRTPPASRRGLVLLAVLVVVVLLSLAAYRYNDVMVAESRATASAARATQSRSFADSGLAYTMAMLAAGPSGPLGGSTYSNPDQFSGIEVPAAPNGRAGRFYVVSVSPADGTGYRFGLTDEGAKINLNTLLDMDKGAGEVGKQVLLLLPNMTEEIAGAILDWLDPDEEPRTPGAENDVYSGMDPAYRCKNGPLDTLEELLLVQGVSAELLFGADKNRNGVIDGDETADGDTLGWSAYLTVYSRSVNVDSQGSQRINVNNADLATLGEQLAVLGPELGTYMLAYRLYGGRTSTDTTGVTASAETVTAKVQADLAAGTAKPKKLRSLWDLVGSQVTVSVGTGRMAKKVLYYSPLNSVEKQKELLPLLMDYCSTSEKWDLAPRVNINTAPEAVITALKDVAKLSETDVTAIMEKRPDPSAGGVPEGVFKSTAWLVTEAGLKPAVVKALEKFITGQTQVYRFQVVGKFGDDKPGPTSRLEAVVDANNGRPRVVYWRDLTELGKGFTFGS
ncbi:MAG: general secretion pathway protein GspK, partial [Gemmataceae bacterium]